MTLNRTSQLVLASAVSLLAAGLVTACGTTLTADFVFVSSAKAAGANNYGEIDVFEINSESGKMRTIPTSPFPSGGRNPVAEAVSPDNTNLYVANEDDNTIVQFIIGNDGKIYPQHTTNTPGIFPLKLAAGGSNLFVVDKYQPLDTCSSAAPCSGSVAVFPIKSDDSLGTAVTNSTINASYWPLSVSASPNDLITPTAVMTATVTSGSTTNLYLYVTALDSTASAGYVFSYWVVPSSTYTIPSGAVCPSVPSGQTVLSAGTLCPLTGSPFAAGTSPSGVASAPGGSYIYVTDAGTASVLAYSANNGILTPVSGSPFAAGNAPSAVVVDGTGNFVYVTNGTDSNVTAYSASNGALTSLGNYPVGIEPVAIGIDPALNEYLYTISFVGSTMNGFQINSSNGTLLTSQGSPYGTNANPTAVAAIPHGATAKE